MLIKKREAFTLVELLIAVMILAGTISGILLLFSTSMVSSQLAWDTTVATSHAEHILEEMQTKDSLEAIRSMNWSDWIISQDLNTLPDEKIEIIFAQNSKDPLDVQVDVQWTRKARATNIKFKTKFTK